VLLDAASAQAASPGLQCFAINSGRHRRIHDLTIMSGAGVAEVTIYHALD
jgi:hypothetical protein